MGEAADTLHDQLPAPPVTAEPTGQSTTASVTSFAPSVHGAVNPAPLGGLVVGAATDPAEAEADAVARDVVVALRAGSSVRRSPAPAPSLHRDALAPLRRTAVSTSGRVIRREPGVLESGPAEKKPTPTKVPNASWLNDDEDAVNAALIGACSNGKGVTNWNQVKDRYADDTATLKKLVDWRKKVVDKLLAECSKEFHVSARASGSDALTSDYDVTFVRPVKPKDKDAPSTADADTPAPRPEEAVQAFNARFRAVFGAEPGWYFDTNVYAEDFLYKPGPAVGGGAPTRDDEAYQLDPEMQQREGLMQDRNALVKIRKNLGKQAWTTMCNDVVATIDDVAVKRLTKAQFRDAETLYRSVYVHEILEGVGEAEKAKAREALGGKGDDEALADYIVGHTSAGFTASNLAYEKNLMKVAEFTNERTKLEARRPPDVLGKPDPNWKKGWDQLTLQIRQWKSKALLFANEPYFSAGTLYHVVGNIQIGYGAKLDVPTLFQSMNENYGDFLKEVRHQRHALEGQPEDAIFAPIAIKCAKYAFRFADAAVELERAGVIAKQPIDLAVLRTCQRKLLAIRQGDALDEKGDTINAKKLGAYRDAGHGNQLVKDALDEKGEKALGADGKPVPLAVPVSKDWGAKDRPTGKADAKAYLTEAGLDSLTTLEKVLAQIQLNLNRAARSTGKEKPGADK